MPLYLPLWGRLSWGLDRPETFRTLYKKPKKLNKKVEIKI